MEVNMNTQFSKHVWRLAFSITLAASLITTSASFAAPDKANIRSLDKVGNDRKLCLTRNGGEVRFKKCDGRSSQSWEIIYNQPNIFALKRGSRCLAAVVTGSIDKAKTKLKDNLKIKAVRCSGDYKEINAKHKPKNNLIGWYIDHANRLRSHNHIDHFTFCLSDGDKNDRVKPNKCAQHKNPGRWRIAIK